MAQTVIGIFDNASAAQNAVERLMAMGIPISDIDISNNSDTTSMSGTSSSDMSSTSSTSGDTDRSDDSFGEKISRFFRNLFEDDDETERYSTVAKRGSVVSVQVDSSEQAQRAAELLDECGAVDVDERARQYSSMSGSTTMSESTSADTESYRDRTTMTSDRSSDDFENSKSIPIIEEEVQIGKREVQTGGMRLRSRIIERPVEESLRLREERVRVDRNPVNRPATEADLNTFREGEIEVRERAEVPIVNKEARVVEEINLRREVGEREETVRDTVRKTDVEIESLDSESTDAKTRKSKNKKDL